MSLNYRLILLVLRTTPRNNRAYHCLANGTTRTIHGNRLHHFTSPSSSSLSSSSSSSFGNFHKFKSYLLYSCSIRSIHFFRYQQLCRKPSQLNLLLSKHFHSKYDQDKNRSTAMLMTALVVIVLGLSYAAVPLYRIYCQKTGTGLQAVAKVDEMNEKVSKMKKISDRKIRVKFEAEKSSRLAWNFKPSQSSITCSPGETILAFYTAKNELDRPVNGIATYTILPYEAGKYFNKIQCFCFEEQQLNANEEVDLPVFFFIDPEYARDPYLFDVDEIILSYNFFETKEGFKLPKPPSFRAHYPSIPNAPQASAIS